MSDWRKLPLIFEDYETRGEWQRCIEREGTVGELSEEGMWDVDDPGDTAEMTQVLRLLRDSTQQLAALREAVRELIDSGWRRDDGTFSVDPVVFAALEAEAGDE